MNDVAVIMPSIDQELAEKTMEQLRDRAGMEADFFVAMDNNKTGFIKTVNEFVKAHPKYKYYVYTAQDAFAGRDWLKIAYEGMERTGRGLFAFSDGKWHGRMAAFGMVRASWKAPFFNEAYEANYADVELSLQAMTDKTMAYDLKSIMIEVDPDKDTKDTNLKDKTTFAERKKTLFDGTVSPEFIERFY